MFDTISKQKIIRSASSQPRKSVEAVGGDFDFLFIPLRHALDELQIRQTDPVISLKNKEFLKKQPKIIQELFSKPRAVMFRQVCTPTHETFRFLKFAKQAKLKPLIIEHHRDKFVSANNAYKKSLGKLPVYTYTGSDGRHMCKYETIIDFNRHNGKSFNEITCHSGRSLIETHHEAFEKLTKLKISEVSIDLSDWFLERGTSAEYYQDFFTLFIQNHILFENYFTEDDEYCFVKNSVIPAFQKVELEYSVPPVIARLLPKHDERSVFWDAYPNKMKHYI